MNNVSVLRQALPYIKRYRDATFVVKLGGELAVKRETLLSICEDITLLSLVGIRPVVVHGGGPQANALSEKLGWKPEIVEGRRVTGEKDLDIAKMVFAGKINVEILSALQHCGAKAVGLSGVDAGILKTKKREVTRIKDPATGQERAVDFGFVGDVTGVDPALLVDLIEKRYIPVISSLGAGEDGAVLNVNADTVGGEIARALKAAKYISLTNVDGVLGPDKKLISTLTVEQAELDMARGVITGGMVPKIRACLLAVQGGVHRAHILNGLAPQVLLAEVFTAKGAGTMIIDRMEKDVYEREIGGTVPAGPDE